MTVQELHEMYKGRFTKQNVAELEAMENKLLWFKSFTSDTALMLGCEIVRQSRQYGEDIAVCILRKADELPIFQYVGSTCARRNLDFARRKANTVERTGHCSLWALAQEETEGGLTALFQEESDSLPVGGAFPVYVEDYMTALIMTSGLHHGKDHEVVVKALCAVRGISLPAYSGPMI